MGETPLAGTVHPNKWDPFCGRRGHEKAAKGMEHLYWIGKKSLFLIFEGPLTISPFLLVDAYSILLQVRRARSAREIFFKFSS